MSVTQPPLIAEMGCQTCQWCGLRQKKFVAKLGVAHLSVNYGSIGRTKLPIVLNLITGILR